MDLFRYFVRFLYKIRWYLVILPMIAQYHHLYRYDYRLQH